MIVKVMSYFFRFNVSFSQENLETLVCYLTNYQLYASVVACVLKNFFFLPDLLLL